LFVKYLTGNLNKNTKYHKIYNENPAERAAERAAEIPGITLTGRAKYAT